MKILLFDNYDSFTYNLLHLVNKVSAAEVVVKKNDEILLEEVDQFDHIIISPGPGIPSDAGILLPLIKHYGPTKKILGVCLGFQGIAEVYGARLRNLDEVFHGVARPVHVLAPDPMFQNIPQTFKAGRYHSWVMDEKSSPGEMIVTAVDENNLIMAARHRWHKVCGVQFHPESILSEYGETLMTNWLKD